MAFGYPLNAHFHKAPLNVGRKLFLILFLRRKILRPHRGTIPGWGTLRVGNRQPEREGYGARSEGVVAESLERSYPWAVGFFFGNVELSLELWTVIAGISGFDD